ncbi:hypothetical protein CPB83DRAFT_198735 [Crepidotus variabilis]|uniref:Uncharacterized protein n=1 Tax=Crepidotus variabilis TaxID=179855 RepID=A0A9P6EJJ5_9AGAR|nr:hypothetical protein CPB83DRAFT_198735 [Crepidotus variabilis]
MVTLSNVALYVKQDLEALLGGAHELQGLHTQISRSSVDIISTFSRMTDSANDHLEALNRSATEIQERFLAQQQLNLWPWRNIAYRFAGLIIRDSSALLGLEHVAWFQLLVASLSGAWSLVYTTSSLILSLGVVILLATRDLCAKNLIKIIRNPR